MRMTEYKICVCVFMCCVSIRKNYIYIYKPGSPTRASAATLKFHLTLEIIIVKCEADLFPNSAGRQRILSRNCFDFIF